jgi:hypothetical protein
VKNNLGSS